jgi:Chain length determinant protein
MSTNQENTVQANFDNDEISLKELILKIKEWFAFLKSKWKTIFLAGIIGGFIGLTIAWFEKPTYKATLTFAMEDDKGGGGGLGGALGLASSFGIDLGGTGGGGAFAASNLTELMKSRLIVEKVLLNPVLINGKTISLAEYYIQINQLRKTWEKRPSLTNIQFLPGDDRSKYTIQQDSILQKIHKRLIDKDHLSIMQKDKKVTILTIEVTSEDEQFSKIFCESIAKETSDFYIETKSKKARLNANVLQKQVDSVRSELNGAITVVAAETDNVYNLNPAFNIKGAASKKKQIDVQANTTILTNLVVQLELAKITLRKETPLIQLIDRPMLPLPKEKFGKLKALILGGFLAGFLTLLYLILGHQFKKMLA